MRLDLKKNEKLTKIITVILIGLLLLVVALPAKNSVNNTSVEEDETKKDIDLACKNYEERLKQILESSYGNGTMEVMVNLVAEKSSYDFMGKSDECYKVDGVFIVAHIKEPNAVSDISYACCALFDLPAHKVYVIVR